MMGSTRRDAATVAGAQVSGIIPLALIDVFAGLRAKDVARAAWLAGSHGHGVPTGPPCDGGRLGVRTSVHIQYCEVYNESVFDLLKPTQPTPTPLRVMEDPLQGVVCVQGLAELPAATPSDVLALLERGNAHRTTEATAANDTSSRSHAILWVTVREEWPSGGGSDGAAAGSGAGVSVGHGSSGTTKRRDARLSLIDLAGSERASATLNSGARLHEGAKINRSLLALANCINALTAQTAAAIVATSRGGGGSSSALGGVGRAGVRRGSTGSELRGSAVNYRDSKLTHLLKSSLEGRCRMIMIANVNPNATFYEDSHNTIK
jgi:kinesin family protein 18/19